MTNFDAEVKSKVNKMIKLNQINWRHNAKIIGSEYKVEWKIVGNKQNHSVQPKKIIMPSPAIQFSIRSYDTKIKILS